jgi:hypothetical protein
MSFTCVLIALNFINFISYRIVKKTWVGFCLLMSIPWGSVLAYSKDNTQCIASVRIGPGPWNGTKRNVGAPKYLVSTKGLVLVFAKGKGK